MVAHPEYVNGLRYCGECETGKTVLEVDLVEEAYKASSSHDIYHSQTISHNYHSTTAEEVMSKAAAGHDGSPNGVELETHPTAQKLAARAKEFMSEIQNLYDLVPHSHRVKKLTLTQAHPAKNSKVVSTENTAQETHTTKISANTSNKASQKAG